KISNFEFRFTYRMRLRSCKKYIFWVEIFSWGKPRYATCSGTWVTFAANCSGVEKRCRARGICLQDRPSARFLSKEMLVFACYTFVRASAAGDIKSREGC